MFLTGKDRIAFLSIECITFTNDQIPLRHVQIKLKFRSIRQKSLQCSLHLHRYRLFQFRNDLLQNNGKISPGNVTAILCAVLHQTEKAKCFSEKSLIYPADHPFFRKVQVLFPLHVDVAAHGKNGTIRFFLQHSPKIRHLIFDRPDFCLTAQKTSVKNLSFQKFHEFIHMTLIDLQFIFFSHLIAIVVGGMITIRLLRRHQPADKSQPLPGFFGKSLFPVDKFQLFSVLIIAFCCHTVQQFSEIL